MFLKCGFESNEQFSDLFVFRNYAPVLLKHTIEIVFCNTKKFIHEYSSRHLNFPLLSDFNKVAAKAFDVLYETFPAFEMQGVSKRAAFVIDKAGVVRYAEVCPTPGDLPNFSAIQACLAAL